MQIESENNIMKSVRNESEKIFENTTSLKQLMEKVVKVNETK